VPEACTTPPDQGQVKQARVTSKRQDDMQRVSEARATVSKRKEGLLLFCICLLHMLAYWTAQDGVRLLLFWSLLGCTTPQDSGGKQGWKRAVRTAFSPFLSYRRLFLFLFLFLFPQFIMQYPHCIKVPRSHVRHHHCTETTATKTCLPTCIYKYLWSWSLSLQASRGHYYYN
jgi:hypothetical protein